MDEDAAAMAPEAARRVMWRRTQQRLATEARIAEMHAREAAAAAEAAGTAQLKEALGPKLDEWSKEGVSGQRKNIRGLLATLHGVLWEGARWEPVAMAKLIPAAKVRFYYLKAVALVHPDKTSALDAAQKFVATEVFHQLEQAWRDFSEKELGGGT
jgi:hypothetical protein